MPMKPTYNSVNFQHEKKKRFQIKKLQKERIALVVCSNVAGSHMLQLLAVGKNMHP